MAGLFVSDKNSTGIRPELFHRCWPFHLAMKPFYHSLPSLRWEPLFYAFFPIWRQWLLRQKFAPADAVLAITHYGPEAFDIADRLGALKVYDAANSHPVNLARILEEESERWTGGKNHRAFFSDFHVPRAVAALKRADLVLCPSHFVQESMLRNGLTEAQCPILPFGVNLSTFAPRTKLPATPRFICVGDMCLRKGHQYLFRAFDIVREQCPDAELVCVGMKRTDILHEFKQWRNRITYARRLPHTRIAELMQNATAFVLLSVEEGYARVLAEAMASGIPVIATPSTGAPSTITDGREGFIVPTGNVEAAAQAMLRLVNDPELCTRMGQAAAETGRTFNSWQDYGDRLLALITNRVEQVGQKHGEASVTGD